MFNHKKTLEESPGFFPGYAYFMLKKLGAVVAVFACSLAISITASASTVSKGKVNADALNVRTMPTTESASMGLLPTDAEVIILSQTDNWYRIYRDGKEAYVCADYIIVTETNVEMELPDPLTSTGVVPVATGEIPSYAGSAVRGEALVELSKQYIGTPYVYGGMSPEGFDCSGFVKYCYSLVGIDVNRVAQDQALNGIEVPVDQMLPGDIICFVDTIGGSYIGHSGIYVGNGYFIHSPRTGYNVEIVALSATSYGSRIKNVRRMFY